MTIRADIKDLITLAGITVAISVTVKVLTSIMTISAAVAVAAALFFLDFCEHRRQFLAGIGQTQSLEDRVISVYNQWEEDWKQENYAKSCKEQANCTKDELEAFIRKHPNTTIEPWNPPRKIEGLSMSTNAHCLHCYACTKRSELLMGILWEIIYGL